MKAAGYMAVFIGGLVVCFLLISLGVVDVFDGVPGTQTDPDLSLPTYLSFLGVMMTAVTVVLTALGIGVGIVAIFTFAGIKEEVQKVAAKMTTDADKRVADALAAVDRKTDEALSEDAIERAVVARFDKITTRRQNPTVAELEEGFDREDNGNR